MDYTYSTFMRHIDQWESVRMLADIFPKPEDIGGDVAIHIGDSMSERAIHLRIMHMLSADGASPDLRKHQGVRFFNALRFIAVHHEAIGKAGFFLLDDGVVQTAPHFVLRAVHETFCGDSSPNPDTYSPDAVIKLAKSFPNEWSAE
jgi:hypothetical protein